MKISMTRKQARAHFRKIYAAPYCWMSPTSKGDCDAVGYNAGIYGWNWDLIPIGNGVAVCTGYRPIGDELPADIARRMDDAARAECDAVNNRTWDYDRAIGNAVLTDLANR